MRSPATRHGVRSAGIHARFGVAADPDEHAKWEAKVIPDDPDLHIPFAQGTLSFDPQGGATPRHQRRHQAARGPVKTQRVVPPSAGLYRRRAQDGRQGW